MAASACLLTCSFIWFMDRRMPSANSALFSKRQLENAGPKPVFGSVDIGKVGVNIA